MPDVHPIRDQPVIVGNLVNLVVALAGAAGVTLAEDTITQVVAGVGALIVIGQTIAAQWGRVTPVARCDAAVAQATSDGIAEGARAYRHTGNVTVDMTGSTFTDRAAAARAVALGARPAGPAFGPVPKQRPGADITDTDLGRI